jgi:hypothetical protein
MLAFPIPIMRRMPHSDLERQLITDYQEKGYSRQDLRSLPEDEAHQLRIAACQYVSSKLDENESHAKFNRKI